MTEKIFKRCPSVDIQFEGLNFNIRENKNVRNILHSLNGSFCAGNLIGILGPSGAGKTSLLNVLAGRITQGISGNIKINGVQRDLKAFQKLSCYIMQEDLIQKQLTVKEAMDYAAKLKLDNNLDARNKDNIVENVINMLGLQATKDTRTEHLSGGQRKRVAIALELINNPPVLFLDEPTTGLDNVVAKQCIQLLKELAKQGRTIICTIHQPSDLLFYLFDQVYFMSEGLCVYNGSVNVIVPFLQRIEYPCPAYSSPADYLIELSGNNKTTKLLSTASSNGKINNCDTILTEKFIAQSQVYNPTTNPVEKSDDIFEVFRYPVPFHVQVYVLLSRMFLQLSRNKTVLGIQTLNHVLSAAAIGMSFFAVGNNANQAIANFKLQIAMIVFYVYTYIMSPILLFPFELEVIKREYFNHWYSLKAYYTSLTISNIPLMIILSFLFNCLVYVMTDQPMEIPRFFYFNIVTLIIALTSYGIGLSIGSTFKPTMGAVIGSALGVVLLLICMYGMGYHGSVGPIMKFFMFLDYMRHGLEGLCVSLLRDRDLLDCADEIYCHFRDPELILRTMGMSESSIEYALMMSAFYLIFCRLIAYVALKRVIKPKISIIKRGF
nr:ATP-binding cassette sub-family G member 4-like isoform X1 [Onthophagus taurus]